MHCELCRSVFGEIEQVEVGAGACDGGVEPSVKIVGLLLGRHVAEVDYYVFPLSTLGLVARDGIGIFYLEGVPVGRLAHLGRVVGDGAAQQRGGV